VDRKLTSPDLAAIRVMVPVSRCRLAMVAPRHWGFSADVAK
jgi:hypothetical protein